MKTLGLLALLVLSVVGSCTLMYPRAIVHARLTVEVETPEGLRTGSTVSKLGYSLEPAIGTRGINVGVPQGEAVVVDLGERGTLFALLSGRSPETGEPSEGYTRAGMYMAVLAPAAWKGPRDRNFIYAMRAVNAKGEVPIRLLPMLVRFRDEKDPKTVEAVDPANLAASFGDGVRLKRVTIETTSDQVTDQIGNRLTWLHDFYGKMLDGDRSVAHRVPPPSLANALAAGSFKIPKD